jgi:hypothetical protein
MFSSVTPKIPKWDTYWLIKNEIISVIKFYLSNNIIGQQLPIELRNILQIFFNKVSHQFKKMENFWNYFFLSTFIFNFLLNISRKILNSQTIKILNKTNWALNTLFLIRLLWIKKTPNL